MNLKIHSAKHTPNLIIVANGVGNLLFGYQEKPMTKEDSVEIYQSMKLVAKDIVNSMPINSFETGKDYSIYVKYGFVRARQVLEISMPFIYRNGSVISDPNGANILQRKISAVYN